MFTVKLFIYNDNGSKTTRSLSCPHYEAFERESGNITITVFKDHTQEIGVDFHLVDRGDDKPMINQYDHCYIENQSGKTIAHYSAKSSGQGHG